jgi:hypothetical protein
VLLFLFGCNVNGRFAGGKLQVKDAYMKLTDGVQKKNFIMHIENATEEFKRERRKLTNKGVSKKTRPSVPAVVVLAIDIVPPRSVLRCASSLRLCC